MNQPYFFEIPIYRCDPQTHENEMEKNRKKYVNEDSKDIAPHSFQNMQNFFSEDIRYDWRYNEIIGWLCLYILGTQVRGDYYFVSAKKINKGILKKKFKIMYKAFELSLDKTLTSQEIFNEILSEIEYINLNVNPFKKRYFDIETFKVIGQFIDWKYLTQKLSSFRKD